MKKTILLYSAAMALLVLLMKFIDYRFLIRDISVEFYIGAVAILFTALGVWVGLKFTSSTPKLEPSVPRSGKPQNNLEAIAELGLSKREMEVLELMAQGLSNQEIAEKLFISLNTVKTHSSKLFQKLSARRRTQAVQIAKSKGIIS
ncbi:MAG: response regulator transcription factor [Bacteroidota bacterium]